jgi:hypothetical protein
LYHYAEEDVFEDPALTEVIMYHVVGLCTLESS